MKILIFSDSHERFNYILEMYNSEKPDVVISAGDHSSDAEELFFAVNEEVPFYIVRGNTDHFDKKYGDMEEFVVEGVKFFITHGHLFGVKSGYEKIIESGKSKGADVVIFGHTHNRCQFSIENTLFINPGPALWGSYGTLTINGESIQYEEKQL